MKRSDFTFELPEQLIAQHPLEQRSDGRLLQVSRESGALRDRLFTDLPGLLEPDDLLVFNDTRVIPARLFGHKESGGKVEILVERMQGDFECLAQLRSSKSPRAGQCIVLEDSNRLEVIGREDSFFILRSSDRPLGSLLEQLGHIPLPPYIKREEGVADHPEDLDRYQTVFADSPGAVAAPTAGLHFDEKILAAIDDSGARRTTITLHVGAGTFQPVRVENIEDHQMHSEYLEVSEAVCQAVAETRERGGRIIGVGTTAVRSLETAARNGNLVPFSGESQLFIYPGYRFKVVDGMMTNFHLPESTLLMLVCAFAGQREILNAYRHAVDAQYRFFSYGDAMVIL